jgi:hypothetical protein
MVKQHFTLIWTWCIVGEKSLVLVSFPCCIGDKVHIRQSAIILRSHVPGIMANNLQDFFLSPVTAHWHYYTSLKNTHQKVQSVQMIDGWSSCWDQPLKHYFYWDLIIWISGYHHFRGVTIIITGNMLSKINLTFPNFCLCVILISLVCPGNRELYLF